MAMIELNDLLPSSQWENNWTFYGAHHEGLPNDRVYVVFEYYCNTPGCDCKSLSADVKALDQEGEPLPESLALIDYSWSTASTECHPTLSEKSPKTATSMHILEVYKKFIHHPDYLPRIKNQYMRVKELVAGKPLRKTVVQKNLSGKRIGRNEKCPCGSNKKYKKCCFGAQSSQDI